MIPLPAGGAYVCACLLDTYDAADDSPIDRLAVQKEDVCLKAVPYFLWNNRGQGEMVTWVNVV